MNTYEVIYLKDDEKKIAYIQGGNKAEAGNAFAKKYPDVKDDNAILSVENMDIQSEEDYGTSIFVASVVAFIGWLAVFGGLALILMAGAESAKAGRIGIGTILALLPTAGVFVSGLVLVIIGQTSRAVLDNANYSRQMLAEMRKGK